LDDDPREHQLPPAVFLGLGANVGAPRRQLLTAIVALSRRLGPLRVAPLYRTAPLSAIPQPDFLNTVVGARSDVSADELLAFAKGLEGDAGRRQGPRDGPRPLDVDLLVVGDVVRSDEALTIPHPGLLRRRFVLVPFADLAPSLRLPGDGTTIARALAELDDRGRVDPVPWVG